MAFCLSLFLPEFWLPPSTSIPAPEPPLASVILLVCELSPVTMTPTLPELVAESVVVDVVVEPPCDDDEDDDEDDEDDFLSDDADCSKVSPRGGPCQLSTTDQDHPHGHPLELWLARFLPEFWSPPAT